MKVEDVIKITDPMNRAFDSFFYGMEHAKRSIEKDGALKRFEFTIELLWKTVKVILRYEQIDCSTPRSCIKEAFRNGLLIFDEIYLDMLEDRNRSSHVYDEEQTDEIIERIRKDYVPELKLFRERMNEYVVGINE